MDSWTETASSMGSIIAVNKVIAVYKIPCYSPHPAGFSPLMADCLAYEDELRRGGHFVGGEALQSVKNAATLRYQNDSVVVTDGPFAETREQLGGYFLIEAVDLDEAIAIAGRIPAVHKGTVEIRPVLELTGLPLAQ